MRRVRLGRSSAWTGIATFLIVSLVLVGSGYLIGRYLLASLFQKSSQTATPGKPATSTQGTTSTVQVQLKPVTLYRVQLGAYSTKENADKAASLAQSKGVSAQTVSPDPLYRVYCGLYASKEAATKAAQSAQNKLAGSVIGTDEKLLVSTVEIPSKTVTLTGNKDDVARVQKALTSANNALLTLGGYWDASLSGTTQTSALTSLEAEVKSAKDDLAKITSPGSLKAAVDAATKLTNELESAVRAAKEAAGGDSSKISSGMTQFIKFVDLYAQEVKNP